MDEPAPVWPQAPRYGPDEPFPATRFVPGRHPHPRRDPRGSLYGAPDPAPGLPPNRWREDVTYLRGIDLYHAGYLWEAHEYFEAGYFATDDDVHRDLLQVLTQLAAALLNAHRGHAEGFGFLTGRVVSRLEQVTAAVPEGERLAGLDPHRLLADVRSGARPHLELHT